MKDQRIHRAKLSTVGSLLSQIVAFICGLIVPRLLIKSFGSEAYAATTSIASFLSYISLLEGGVGGVARAALYKPLAEKDTDKISSILGEVKRFFKWIGYAAIVYTIILAISYKNISAVEYFDWASSALLVIVIGISTMAQYFIGISYSALIQADQRAYVISIISIFTTITNTIVVVVLVSMKCGLITVKLISSLIFIVRPILMRFYVYRHYKIKHNVQRDKNALSQKWTGLGQHIAYFLHSNTDVAVLTLFGNLKLVAVYSVYHMAVSHIMNIATSITTGMEAMFGDMLAKHEYEKLETYMQTYETLVSVIGVVLFSTVLIMIQPFVNIYTRGIYDANYQQGMFGVLVTIAITFEYLRKPYNSMITAAGHFKQTRIAAYGEAIINITVSIILVVKFGLIGVAIGTISATLFRLVYSVWYLSKNIICRNPRLCIKRQLINVVSIAVAYIGGKALLSMIVINNYFIWAICACVGVAISLVVSLISNRVFYPKVLFAAISIVFEKKNIKHTAKK